MCLAEVTPYTSRGKASVRMSAIAASCLRFAPVVLLFACGVELPKDTDESHSPGASPLRRLTNTEYDNTVADLLGDTTAPATTFPGETTSTQGYDTFATGLGVSVTHARSLLTAAEALATAAVRDKLTTLLGGCDVATSGEETCVRTFVTTFGERAFRRPLTEAEVARFTQLQASVRATHDFPSSIRLTLEAFLLSPDFLYRVELGERGDQGDVVKPTSFEMASRLSYLFAGSMPDDELFRAARADELQTAAQIERQARRLLELPRARTVFTHFADQWLELRSIVSMQKTANAFPGYDDSLKPLMKEEANRLVDSVVWDGDGDVYKLLTADYSFVNGELASFYGITGVGGEFMRVALDPAQRKGLLTLAGVLASHGKPDQTLPARRGKFVRSKIFCIPVGDPPPGALEMAPQRLPGMTTREYFTLVDQQPACGGCHVPLDGLGYGLENYDSVGRWRTTDLGKPIDSTGEILDTDVDGPFMGGVELADRVAQSADVATCVSRQLFQFAAGRPDGTKDALSMSQLGKHFEEAHHDLRELMVALTQTDAFLFMVSQGAQR